MAFSSFNSIQTFIRYVSTSVSSFLFPSIDPSLALYYPFDISQNRTKTANYASGQAVYDATFGGNVVITNTTNAFVAGLGDLSLNNVMGSNTATNYVVSGNSFALNSSGLTVSFWFACNGVANTVSTAVCLPLNSSGAKLEIDISGSTMVYSNLTTYFSNGYNAFSGCIAFSGNYFFVPNHFGNAIIQSNLTTGAIINKTFNTGITTPSGCAVYADYIYVSNQIAAGIVSQINLATGAMVNNNWKVGFVSPIGLRVFGGYLYVINSSPISIYKLDFAGNIIWQTQTSPTNVIDGAPYGVAFSGNYMYVSIYNLGKVSQFNISNGALVNNNWLVLSTNIYDVAIYNDTYAYVSMPGLGTIVKVQLVGSTVISNTWASGLNGPTGLNIYNNLLYVFCFGDQSIRILSLP